MKEYPSINGSCGQAFREFDAHVFDKLDGSNLRFEWSKKAGWHKYGTRRRLFDESDTVFGCAIKIFGDTMAEPLAKIATDEKWQSVVCFAEFYGSKSFAGFHEVDDEKTLTLFDISPYKKGILGPKDFRTLCEGKVPTATYLGQYKWTRGFVTEVWEGRVEGVTKEGVVGKAGEGHELIRAKAKTRTWVDAVHARMPPDEAEKVINS